MSISLGPECVVFSVPALSLVDCDSPVDVFCIVSSCFVAGCWPVFSLSFSSSFLSPSCLVSSLGGSTFGLGLSTIRSQVSITTLLLQIFVQFYRRAGTFRKVLKLLKLLIHPLLLLMLSTASSTFCISSAGI